MWEGQLKAELRDGLDAERWAQWKRHPASFVFAEDEHAPLGDLARRAAEEWSAVVAATPAATTSLVVAHGAFNRAFVLSALGLPVDDYGFIDAQKRFEFENCELIELRFREGSAHAADWRRRYPREGAWTSREEEHEARVAGLQVEKSEL